MMAATATIGQTASIPFASGGYSNNNLHGHSLSKRSPINPLFPVAIPAAKFKSKKLFVAAGALPFTQVFFPKAAKKSFVLGVAAAGK